jgi:multiple sugar transport system permease protein
MATTMPTRVERSASRPGPASRARTPRARAIRRHVAIYAGLAPFLVLAVFPIFWMLITALKQDPDLYRMDVVPFWFHLPPTWRNFDFLFYNTSYRDWMVNTMAISFWVSVITLLTAVPAGYALARLRLPFAENLGIGIFMTYLVPAIILFIPMARVVSLLELQDSWWALVVVYPTFTIPFCTWLLMGFFKTVPFEIEEAAMVDGCGQLGALCRVVLPVSWPGVITATIFSFTLSMQDFLYSLAFVSVSDQKPVPLGVATELIRGDVFFWGSLMAGALLVGVPVAIVYNLFLDKFISGITGAAIK